MHLSILLSSLFVLPTFATLQYTDFPHLLIPLNKNTPNTAAGTKDTGEISQDIHTEVSFDVRSDVPAAICRINFHINTNPKKGAPRELKGQAPFQFIVSRLQPTINKDKDTWFSHPPVTGYVATVTLGQDGYVDVKDGWFDCPKGQVAQFLLTPLGTRSFKYWWFELDYDWSVGGPHGITLEMHT